MKANSNIWSKLKQGYFFIGQQEFGTGLFVPFYNSNTGSGQQPLNTSPATNINITSSSYTKNVGLSNLPVQSGINTGIANNNANWPSTTESEGRSAYTFLSGINDYSEFYPWSMNRLFTSDRWFGYEGNLNPPDNNDPENPIPASIGMLFYNNNLNPLIGGFGYSYDSGDPTFPMEGGFGVSDNRTAGDATYYFAGSAFSGTQYISDSPNYDAGNITIASKRFSSGGPLFSDTHTVVASAFGVGGLDIPALDTIVKALRTAIA
jgi:hypothetical protein